MPIDFQGKRILILQDNPVAGAEIAIALSTANATVLGPCHDLGTAEMQVMHSELAILDVDVRGRRTFALADRLAVLNVPYVFFSATASCRLPERFARIDCIARPSSPLVAVRRLEIRSSEAEPPTSPDLVPLLRQRACGILKDPLAADRLVERTLQLALEDSGTLPCQSGLLAWLHGLMDRALQVGRSQFLN